MAALHRVAVPRWPAVQLEWLHHYHDRLRDAGLEPVDLPEVSSGLAGCSGLLLTGGVDVDPALYREAPHPRTQPPVRARDEMELVLLREALAADLPVFAICRGLQLLNVCLGGSLLQHIDNETHVVDEGNVSRWHDVSIAEDSRLYGVLGRSRVVVNSRHHQAVTPDRLAPGLRISATSDDGLVEALEGTAQRWLTAVQWHPERLETESPGFAPQSQELFRAFAKSLDAGVLGASKGPGRQGGLERRCVNRSPSPGLH